MPNWKGNPLPRAYINASINRLIRVDGVNSVSNLQKIVDWLCDYSESTDQIFMFIFNHGSIPQGGVTYVPLNYNEYLFDYNLGDMLNDADLDYAKLICLIEACYSGAFIPDIYGSNRIIITSNDDSHTALGWVTLEELSPGQSLPAWVVEPEPWFSMPFMRSLAAGNNFRDAFVAGVTKVDFYIAKCCTEFGEVVDQNPLLDDNGDGVGNQYVPIGGDGINGGLAALTFI